MSSIFTQRMSWIPIQIKGLEPISKPSVGAWGWWCGAKPRTTNPTFFRGVLWRQFHRRHRTPRTPRFRDKRLAWIALGLGLSIALLTAGCAPAAMPLPEKILKEAIPFGWQQTNTASLLILKTSVATDTPWGWLASTDEATLQLTPIVLVSPPAILCGPLSPDGQFLLCQKGFENRASYLVSLTDGSQKLFREQVILSHAWLPNSQQLAIWTDDKLLVTDLAGQTQQELWHAPGYYIETMAWSPDGQRLAFVKSALAGDDRTFGVFNVQTNTTTLFAWDDTVMGIYDIGWSPDGRYLVYIESINVPAAGALVIRPVDGTAVRYLKFHWSLEDPEKWVYSKPYWSPQNDYIAVARHSPLEEPTTPLYKYDTLLIPVPTDLHP